MWKYVYCAIISGFIQYLIVSTQQIYNEFLKELLPQVAAENRHNVQYDMIHALLDSRMWRITLLLPVAFVCTFILLPYDVAKAWYAVHNFFKHLLGK